MHKEEIASLKAAIRERLAEADRTSIDQAWKRQAKTQSEVDHMRPVVAGINELRRDLENIRPGSISVCISGSGCAVSVRTETLVSSTSYSIASDRKRLGYILTVDGKYYGDGEHRSGLHENQSEKFYDSPSRVLRALIERLTPSPTKP